MKPHRYARLSVMTRTAARPESVSELTTVHSSSVRASLDGAGLKRTLARQSVLEVFERAMPHPLTAEGVYRVLLGDGTDVGAATVYRVLAQFESAGLVRRYHFEGGPAVFELGTGDLHDHIVCVKTGRMATFRDEAIGRRLAEIADELGYDIHRYELMLYGEHRESARRGAETAEASIGTRRCRRRPE